MDKLFIGNTVTITVKNVLYPMRDRYANNVIIDEFDTFTGIIMREKFFTNDEIGITTDNKYHKFRRIRLADIVKVNDVSVNYDTPVTNEKKTVTVTGSRGDTYIVTKENGHATCTCPGYSFRRTCKHSQDLLSQ